MRAEAATTPAVAGIAVPPDRLADVAERLGVPLARPGGATATIIVSSQADSRTVRQALDGGARCFLQLSPGGGLPPYGPVLDRLPGCGGPTEGLVLWLSTGAAFSLDSASLLCDWLARRGVLPAARRPDMELATHEALSNAIVHGNLGIVGGASNQPGGFERFYSRVMDQLGQPDVAARRIAIEVAWDATSITVSVSDQGTGFDQAGLPVNRTDAKSGRGLQIIREIADEVRFLEGGSRIVLKFRR